MKIATSELFESIRREDPETWDRTSKMLEELPKFVSRADTEGEIPQSFWSVVPVDFQNRINVPVEYGGAQLTATAVRRAIVIERMGRICPGMPIGLPGPGLSTPPVLSLGTSEQKRAYFSRFVGRKEPVWGAFAITEPQSGSDATSMRTVATRSGDHYVLDGDKCFITCGARAEVIVVFATLDPKKGRFGIRAFVVPRGTPGFSVARREDMMGLRASQLTSLSFSDCALPAENMLGHNGKRGPWIDAFTGAQGAWDYMRPVLASLMNGSCSGMLDHAARRLDEGDGSLSRRQLDAAREELRLFRARVRNSQLLALRAAWKFDHGERSSMDASMAKAFASGLAVELSHRLAMLFPIQAATRGNPVEKFLRDAKGFDIIEGTGDMQRLLITHAYAS